MGTPSDYHAYTQQSAGVYFLSGQVTWLHGVFSVLTGWWACSGGGWDMAVCSGLWWDVGACWSLGSCGVSRGLVAVAVAVAGLQDFAPGGAGAAAAAGGLSLGLRTGTGGLGWLCSRSLGGFLVSGGVEGRTDEDEEGWTS